MARYISEMVTIDGNTITGSAGDDRVNLDKKPIDSAFVFADLGGGNDILRDNEDDGWFGNYYMSVHGGDGNDSLYGGSSPDALYGDAGNDYIYLYGDLATQELSTAIGGAGNDTIDIRECGNAYGGEGRDTIIIKEPVETGTISGGAGDDTLVLIAPTFLHVKDVAVDTVERVIFDNPDFSTSKLRTTDEFLETFDRVGFRGKRFDLYFTDQTDFRSPEIFERHHFSLIGSGSDDIIKLGEIEGLTLSGGKGDDILQGRYVDGGQGFDTIYGTDLDDHLTTGRIPDADILYAGDGDDHVASLYSGDKVYAGDGDDTIISIRTRKQFHGMLSGGNGDDVLHVSDERFYGLISLKFNGGAGTDTLYFAEGTIRPESSINAEILDVIGVIATPDQLSDFDVIRLHGKTGIIGLSQAGELNLDKVEFGDGKVYGVRGSKGDDTIFIDAASGQNLSISGGKGDDRIASGGGDDRMTGGDGADLFVFGHDFGDDRIDDFASGRFHDVIDLSDVASVSSFSDVTGHVKEDKWRVTITLDEGSITLYGVSSENLDDSMFVF
ncbi:hypothetical protein [Rhizobium sp. TRM95796]|uniref:hypothetical protein n=1 Tax=Rhizobium sp. TRM95796 TaxID=2979862 RepID=UPI0021E7C3ED|nr:hypothetical protein [Rhizobium sp. TRM95796]MCV3766671.1 hypothetical protein [Rhizobium sp. TRM95796]